MPQPLQLLDLTKILGDQLYNSIPELRKLDDVIESQDWHDNQSVFDHSIASARALEKIARFDYLPDEASGRLRSYLNSHLDKHTRIDLLRLATLLHDIGKIISFQRDARGNTTSPSHGLIGGWAAEPVVDRFNITSKEKAFVLNLISDHLLPSDLIEMAINNQTDAERVVALLWQHRPDSTVELLLLGYADWLGCRIREGVLEERDKREQTVHRCLFICASALTRPARNA